MNPDITPSARALTHEIIGIIVALRGIDIGEEAEDAIAGRVTIALNEAEKEWPTFDVGDEDENESSAEVCPACGGKHVIQTAFCVECNAPTVTEREAQQFMAECDAGQHPLSPEDEAAMDKLAAELKTWRRRATEKEKPTLALGRELEAVRQQLAEKDKDLQLWKASSHEMRAQRDEKIHEIDRWRIDYASLIAERDSALLAQNQAEERLAEVEKERDEALNKYYEACNGILCTDRRFQATQKDLEIATSEPSEILRQCLSYRRQLVEFDASEMARSGGGVAADYYQKAHDHVNHLYGSAWPSEAQLRTDLAAAQADVKRLSKLAAMPINDRINTVCATSPSEEGTQNNLRSVIDDYKGAE